MPLKTPDWIKVNVLSVKSNHENWGAPRIYKELSQEAARGGYELPISESTVTRILRNDWVKLPEEKRWQYRHFYWPESMERGYLPWEASAAALELLGYSLSLNPRMRPSIRMVKWYWRITTATPGMPAFSKSWTEEPCRELFARLLSVWESEVLGQAPEEEIRKLERRLAWEAVPHGIKQLLSKKPPDGLTGGHTGLDGLISASQASWWEAYFIYRFGGYGIEKEQQEGTRAKAIEQERGTEENCNG